MSIESIKLLREKAEKNIFDYCNKYNESFTEVRSELISEADNYNLLLPIDFYVKYYNLTVELTKL